VPPKTTLWPLEPHSQGKHAVLKAYLEAWFPKLGFGNGRVLFIDGFAGPGEYETGETGSPLVALNTLVGHKHRDKIASSVSFVFIERDAKRCRHLERLLEARRRSLPEGWSVDVVESTFDGSMTRILDLVDDQRIRLAPCFVMVDPFGVSDTPMSVIEGILRNNRSEVYVSLMYEAINRFKVTPQFERHLDALFGCPDWREGLGIESATERKAFLFDLYERQLRAAGARQVVHFELYEEDRLVYAVFFGSGHWQGADVMKKAVWSVAPFGDFAFRGTHSVQLTLGDELADYRPLQEALSRRFRGQGWVDIGSAQRFVGSDATDYHTGHVKKHALKPMEQSGALEVDETTRKKRLTYPDGTRMRFR
jgi:three-Cys-motif partner protein